MNNTYEVKRTDTNEIYQPIRLYYSLFNKYAVNIIFSRLNCMEFDKENDRWTWYLMKEAKRVKAVIPYKKTIFNKKIIKLGNFYCKNDDEMYCDFFSFERAMHAILFLDKYIYNKFAMVSHAAVVNKVFNEDENYDYENFDIFFEHSNIKEDSLEDMVSDIKKLSQIENPQKGIKLLLSYYENKMKQPFPEYEKLKLNFYDTGIEPIRSALSLRQHESIQHWKGDKNYSSYEIYEKILRKLESYKGND